jgi:fatty-acyl-CoA synthase
MRSYAHGPSSTPLCGDTIGERFRATVAAFAGREALVVRSQNRRFTWSELDGEVRKVAKGLIALGVYKGERVGMWSPNRYITASAW